MDSRTGYLVQYRASSTNSTVDYVDNSKHWLCLYQSMVCCEMIFTARCICISAVYVSMWCPSVRPSVTFVSCAKTNKDIFEISSLSGSQAILLFPHQTGWRYSDGNPPNEGVECKGVWKNGDFRPISRCISEMVIVRSAHAARQFVSIEFSFHPYNI